MLRPPRRRSGMKDPSGVMVVNPAYVRAGSRTVNSASVSSTSTSTRHEVHHHSHCCTTSRLRMFSAMVVVLERFG
jgi:hypothetical protein